MPLASSKSLKLFIVTALLFLSQSNCKHSQFIEALERELDAETEYWKDKQIKDTSIFEKVQTELLNANSSEAQQYWQHNSSLADEVLTDDEWHVNNLTGALSALQMGIQNLYNPDETVYLPKLTSEMSIEQELNVVEDDAKKMAKIDNVVGDNYDMAVDLRTVLLHMLQDEKMNDPKSISDLLVDVEEILTLLKIQLSQVTEETEMLNYDVTHLHIKEMKEDISVTKQQLKVDTSYLREDEDTLKKDEVTLKKDEDEENKILKDTKNCQNATENQGLAKDLEDTKDEVGYYLTAIQSLKETIQEDKTAIENDELRIDVYECPECYEGSEDSD